MKYEDKFKITPMQHFLNTMDWLPMATADNNMCPLTVIAPRAKQTSSWRSYWLFEKLKVQFVNEEFDINPVDMRLLAFKATGALTTELLAGTYGIRGTAEFACADKDCASTSRLYDITENREGFPLEMEVRVSLIFCFCDWRERPDIDNAIHAFCLWNFFSQPGLPANFSLCFMCQRGILTPFVGLEFKRIYGQLLGEFENTGHEV